MTLFSFLLFAGLIGAEQSTPAHTVTQSSKKEYVYSTACLVEGILYFVFY